jgi:xanthine dehydrogenase accessory factor
MYHPRPVFEFVWQEQKAGHQIALATMIEVTGASARSCGTHMAISDDGRFAGSLTGGCIETAVVAEALAALNEGQSRTVLYGANSPFIDIRLPCGGSATLLISPINNAELGQQACQLLEDRHSFRLALSGEDQSLFAHPHRNFHFAIEQNAVIVDHIPPLRMALFGDAAALRILHHLATACGAETKIFSGSPALVTALLEENLSPNLLISPESVLDFMPDLWTAAVILFHDHEWETAILSKLLVSDAFFIGAMGSHKTQAERLSRLSNQGIAAESLARVIGPIGAIPSMRDPETLAVSILAQVVDQYNQQFLTASE